MIKENLYNKIGKIWNKGIIGLAGLTLLTTSCAKPLNDVKFNHEFVFSIDIEAGKNLEGHYRAMDVDGDKRTIDEVIYLYRKDDFNIINLRNTPKDKWIHLVAPYVNPKYQHIITSNTRTMTEEEMASFNAAYQAIINPTK